eukprot:CAMPEP_0206018260 /NCGR_PEP_ID=MMETSP1464-20131121/26740_1 /ASSEMBLY_ACC=CAM_ASM_001124 /TAXON_ID=119497 /ORGANISM="Exanthemachrysis gayraliae, Strain RCC1523" /LENGTH=196 /DNA_ID=CAMNT_0053392125 /DNA_START=1 /DNA_END=591 /DNA_ORIENTATION=+
MTTVADDPGNVPWVDSPTLTTIWQSVSDGALDGLLVMAVQSSEQDSFVHQRAGDGRGPLWWAYEFKRPQAHALFTHLGASEDMKDKDGLRPQDVFPGGKQELETFLAESRAFVEALPSVLEQTKATIAQHEADVNARFHDDSDPDESDGVELLDEEDDEDEEDEDEKADPESSLSPEIQAKIAALKAKAKELKDEI